MQIACVTLRCVTLDDLELHNAFHNNTQSKSTHKYTLHFITLPFITLSFNTDNTVQYNKNTICVSGSSLRKRLSVCAKNCHPHLQKFRLLLLHLHFGTESTVPMRKNMHHRGTKKCLEKRARQNVMPCFHQLQFRFTPSTLRTAPKHARKPGNPQAIASPGRLHFSL